MPYQHVNVTEREKIQEGLPSSSIFHEAGFDVLAIGRKTPKECLKHYYGETAVLPSKWRFFVFLV